ncbi:MAG: chorismate-binding protein, partial [Rhodospirillaceae bacterium]
MLLDSAAEAGGRGRWSFVCVRPRRVVLDPADPFAALVALTADLPRASLDPDAPPFTGGIVGWLSFDAGRHLERLPAPLPDDLGVPEAAFGLYDSVVAFDTATHRAWACAPSLAEAEALTALLGDAPLLPPDWTQTAPWTAEQSTADAAARIEAARQFILAGDIFQANITQRFLADLPRGLPPFSLYRRLRSLSPAPFAACASFGGAHLLSASPERFLRVAPGGLVETRPIKGTRKRGATPAEDAALAAELLASEKDRAENLMIVDLMRNDLSRVCRVGSVRVPVLNGLETFASVHHL